MTKTIVFTMVMVKPNNFKTAGYLNLREICHKRTADVGWLGCGKFFSVGGEFVVQQVVELL